MPLLLIASILACRSDPKATDADGDGFSEEVDCDDGDRWVYPGSHEREIPGDGVDIDCDGLDACRDLDCDGWPDVVFANGGPATSVESYVYFGEDDDWPASRREDLPAPGAAGVAIEDLDGDGYLDVVMAAWGTDDADGPSVIFWGGQLGLLDSGTTSLSTTGARGVLVEDLDLDGAPDLVFPQETDGSGVDSDAYQIDSAVYWGDPADRRAYGETNRTALPTFGARAVAAADFDGDDDLDLVFANGSTFATRSYLYWNEGGFSEDGRAELPTDQAFGVAAADLDEDGHTDVVFANWTIGGPGTSLVYWGTAEGPTEDEPLRLETVGGTCASVADFDDDGRLDIFFANAYGEASDPDADSFLYWGTSAGWSEGHRTRLPARGGSASAVGDLDDDGDLDIVIASLYGDGTIPTSSTLFWGDGENYDEERISTFETAGAAGVAITPDAR